MKRFEKAYNEVYAAAAVSALWPGFWGAFQKAESPDWINPAMGLGMEVSQALLQQDGEARRLIDTYLGARREEIPPAALEKYGEALRFYGGRLWALYPDGTDDFAYKAVYRFQKKLQKLNGNYTPCKVNSLYLFLHTDRPTRADAEEVAARMAAAQAEAAVQFAYVFLDCECRLYVCSLFTGQVEEIPVPDAVQAALAAKADGGQL